MAFKRKEDFVKKLILRLCARQKSVVQNLRLRNNAVLMISDGPAALCL